MKIDGVNLQILKLLSEGDKLKEIAHKVEMPMHRVVKIIDAMRLIYDAKNATHLVFKAHDQLI